jgi:ABC-type multidrug transport system fused ATPase/permease subunit
MLYLAHKNMTFLAEPLGQPALGSYYWCMCCLLIMASCAHPFILFKLIHQVPSRVLASSVAAAAVRPDAPAAQAHAKATLGVEEAGGGKSNFFRLLSLSRSDFVVVGCGFLSLCVAAATGTFIPHFTGVIVDCIVANSPDFNSNMLMLLFVCFAQAVFTGGRGFCMSIAIARLKVRLQEMLFRTIVMQEQAFFDTSSTGELVSRLSSDTTKVGDMVSLNINIFLRSFIAAVGSLAFMFLLSWRLTIVTFSILPASIALSQVYGKWVQALSERSQTRMADCNKKAESCISSIATVRSFAAEQKEADS